MAYGDHFAPQQATTTTNQTKPVGEFLTNRAMPQTRRRAHVAKARERYRYITSQVNDMFSTLRARLTGIHRSILVRLQKSE